MDDGEKYVPLHEMTGEWWDAFVLTPRREGHFFNSGRVDAWLLEHFRRVPSEDQMQVMFDFYCDNPIEGKRDYIVLRRKYMRLCKE